jgi:hypothetical protein
MSWSNVEPLFSEYAFSGSTTVIGNAVDFTEVKSAFVVQLTITFTSGALTPTIEGSLDGSNWYVVTGTESDTLSGTYNLLQATVPARYLRGVITPNSSSVAIVDMQASAQE